MWRKFRGNKIQSGKYGRINAIYPAHTSSYQSGGTSKLRRDDKTRRKIEEEWTGNFGFQFVARGNGRHEDYRFIPCNRFSIDFPSAKYSL